jgi:dihydroorotase
MTNHPILSGTTGHTGVLLLKGGTLIDPSQGLAETRDIVVGEGKVQLVTSRVPATMHFDEVIDLTGLTLIPGGVDLKCHLREPGREDQETLESGARAAARGGYTTICAQPDTIPVVDTAAMVDFIRVSGAGQPANILPLGAITKGLKGEEISEIGQMYQAGVAALSEGNFTIRKANVLRNALKYAGMFNLPLFLCSTDPDLAAEGFFHEGFVSSSHGYKAIPDIAEEIIVARDLALARYTGTRIHLHLVTTATAAGLIRRAKAEGVKVTADTAMQYIVFCDEDIRDLDTAKKFYPPVRSRADRQALVEALRDGTIDCIVTDHQPATIEEKDCEFDKAHPGAIGLESTIGLVLEHLHKKAGFTLGQCVSLISQNPARVLNLPYGTLKPGSRADITVLDLKASPVFTPEDLCSLSQNSPWFGSTLGGKVALTMLAGKVVYKAG